MWNKMPKEGWVSISLPEEMVNEIRRVVEEKPELGYKSISDFIVHAIRSYVDYRKSLSGKVET